MERSANASWKGNLAQGHGYLSSSSGALRDWPYSFKGRFEDESGKSGTNPEELLAAAHCGCFTMQFSHMLALNGTPPVELNTTAKVGFEKDHAGFTIRTSHLIVTGNVPGITEDKFKEIAQRAKEDCPVSRVFKGLDISIEAKLSDKEVV